MRQVNSRFASNDALVQYRQLKRRTTAAAIVLLVLVAGALAWVFVPQPAMASMFDWSKPSAIPTLYTGASFSVTIASLDSADRANDAAARVRSSGCPPSRAARLARIRFIRRWSVHLPRSMKPRRLSGASAEWDTAARGCLSTSRFAAHRAASGLSTPRERSPRAAPGRTRSTVARLRTAVGAAAGHVGAAGRATLQIDAGPMPAPAQPQQWSAPDGVHLLHTVSIESRGGTGWIELRTSARGAAGVCESQRPTEGRRVYVDLTWPLDEEEEPRAHNAR